MKEHEQRAYTDLLTELEMWQNNKADAETAIQGIITEMGTLETGIRVGDIIEFIQGSKTRKGRVIAINGQRPWKKLYYTFVATPIRKNGTDGMDITVYQHQQPKKVEAE